MIVAEDTPDFRDPKEFWDDQTRQWKVVLAAGQEVQFYSSDNLKDWKYESSFGLAYGNHNGVWECPDLIRLPFEGKDKWVLLLNINPGGPFGGSATQYFVGSFDGKTFKCDDLPTVTRWMDYGKDHYAAVTWSNAPAGRTVAIAWMSNWQYANSVPTKQFRSANSVPRDLSLVRKGKEVILKSTPSPEVEALRGRPVQYTLSASPFPRRKVLPSCFPTRLVSRWSSLTNRRSRPSRWTAGGAATSSSASPSRRSRPRLPRWAARWSSACWWTAPVSRPSARTSA